MAASSTESMHSEPSQADRNPSVADDLSAVRNPQSAIKRLLLFLGKIALWLGLVALSITATRLLIVQARAEFAFEYSTLSDRIGVAPELDPSVADYAKSRGDFWSKTSVPPQFERAAVEYRKALELNPHEAFHWNDWAQVCWRLGRIQEAEKAFAMAESLDPKNYVIQRDIGNFFLSRQDAAAAAPHHARAIQLNPALARSVYAVYWNLGQDTLTVGQNLLGQDTKLWHRYFLDCLTWVSPEEAAKLWDALRARGDILSEDCYAAYFDYLIGEKLHAAAKDLWGQIVRDLYRTEWSIEGERFWNGNFNFPLVLDGGLEWRIARQLPRGVSAVVSATKGNEKSNCLWIHFDGKENVAFSHVRHGFFVEPGKTYLLRSRVNSLDLSTDNGVYVRLAVFSDPPLVISGQILTGSGSRDGEIEFTVPPGGQWGEITICRDASQKLNNRIKGDVWYDDFALVLKEETTTGTTMQ